MNKEFFDNLNDWIRGTENSIVNFLSAFAPWLAPITPAYMTFQHSFNTLKFPLLVAVGASVVVEILGFSAVSTFLSFWFYNRKNTAESKKAPIGVVIIAFAFYLSLIVTSNVLLDSFTGERWAEIAVRALFTLQTIPAALLVAVRTQHRELLLEISKEKERKLLENKKVSEEVSNGDGKKVESFQKVSSDWRKVRPTLTPESLRQLANLSPEAMRQWSAETGFTYKTISNWRNNAREELGMNQELLQ